jgi:hypothetical protein
MHFNENVIDRDVKIHNIRSYEVITREQNFRLFRQKTTIKKQNNCLRTVRVIQP